MKKKWLSWLLISIAALVAVAIIFWLRYGNKLFYKNVYTDTTNQISFAYPEAWTIMTGATNPYLVVTVSSPNISEYTPILNITKEQIPSDMSLDVYISQTMRQLKEVIAEFSQNEPVTLNVDGQPARKISFSGMFLTKPFSWEQVYTIKDNNIYVMTYVAPTDKFSTERDAIETSFSTFSFVQ